MSLDIAALYEAHQGPLHGFVANRLRGADDAVVDDLVADVWERAVRAAPSFQGRGVEPKIWLYRIARNLLIDRYRERSRKVTLCRLGDLKLYVDYVGTPDHVARLDAQACVAGALVRITDLRRTVIMTRYFEGCSIQQASTALGRSQASVKQAQKLALIDLRRMMGAA